MQVPVGGKLPYFESMARTFHHLYDRVVVREIRRVTLLCCGPRATYDVAALGLPPVLTKQTAFSVGRWWRQSEPPLRSVRRSGAYKGAVGFFVFP